MSYGVEREARISSFIGYDSVASAKGGVSFHRGRGKSCVTVSESGMGWH
jgi:hypothetical protein